MKIWCLRCGEILAQTNSDEKKVILCPHCSEKIGYSVNGNEAYITCLNYGLPTNNEIYITTLNAAV